MPLCPPPPPLGMAVVLGRETEDTPPRQKLTAKYTLLPQNALTVENFKYGLSMCQLTCKKVQIKCHLLSIMDRYTYIICFESVLAP